MMSQASVPIRKFIDDAVFGRGVIRFWTTDGVRARVALVLAMAASFALFSFGSTWLAVPPLAGFDGSLLREPSPILAIISVALLLVITTIIGTILAGAVRFEAGLFAAMVGLTCISLRGGTMQSVLFEVAGSQNVYFVLIFELIILSIMLVSLWAMLWSLGKAHLVHPTPQYEHIEESVTVEPPAPGGDLTGNIIALATQVVATAIIIMCLCQSESKKQALASVAIASILGTSIAYMGFPTRPSIWFWSGPLIVGFIGYLLAAFGQNTGLETGNPQGFFAALARPLPLDYASVGPAAAILGYWMMRKPHAAHLPIEDGE